MPSPQARALESPPPPSGWTFLDWLQILAFAALVAYPVGMYCVSWDFHVQSPDAGPGPGLRPWMMLTKPWRMNGREVEQEVRVQSVQLDDRQGGQLEVSCLIASEVNAPAGAKPVVWRLL